MTLRTTIINLARTAARQGNRVPALRAGGLSAYEIAMRCARLILSCDHQVVAVYLRGGMARGEVEPGDSDIDMTAVIETPKGRQLLTASALQQKWRRSKTWLPVLGELQILTSREVSILSAWAQDPHLEMNEWRLIWGQERRNRALVGPPERQRRALVASNLGFANFWFQALITKMRRSEYGKGTYVRDEHKAFERIERRLRIITELLEAMGAGPLPSWHIDTVRVEAIAANRYEVAGPGVLRDLTLETWWALHLVSGAVLRAAQAQSARHLVGRAGYDDLFSGVQNWEITQEPRALFPGRGRLLRSDGPGEVLMTQNQLLASWVASPVARHRVVKRTMQSTETSVALPLVEAAQEFTDAWGAAGDIYKISALLVYGRYAMSDESRRHEHLSILLTATVEAMHAVYRWPLEFDYREGPSRALAAAVAHDPGLGPGARRVMAEEGCLAEGALEWVMTQLAIALEQTVT